MNPPPRLTLFYDGECPFCRREVAALRRRDRRAALQLQDIAAPGFDAARYGLSREEVHRALHARTADGRILRGMEAVRAAYRAVGLGGLAAPTGWPLLRPLFDAAYAVFARHRRRWGRRFGRSGGEAPRV